MYKKFKIWNRQKASMESVDGIEIPSWNGIGLFIYFDGSKHVVTEMKSGYKVGEHLKSGYAKRKAYYNLKKYGVKDVLKRISEAVRKNCDHEYEIEQENHFEDIEIIYVCSKCGQKVEKIYREVSCKNLD